MHRVRLRAAVPLTPQVFPVTPFSHSRPGYETQTFDWETYLEKTKSKAAPARLFNMVRRLQTPVLGSGSLWQPGAISTPFSKSLQLGSVKWPLENSVMWILTGPQCELVHTP